MIIGWLTFGLSALTLIVIPALILLYRGMLKWTRVEIELQQLIKDVQTLVKDKDRVHTEIITKQDQVHNEIMQIQREDRLATDRRLRWLEENLWRRIGERDKDRDRDRDRERDRNRHDAA